jgi:hypothetical protein
MAAALRTKEKMQERKKRKKLGLWRSSWLLARLARSRTDGLSTTTDDLPGGLFLVS